MQAALPIVIVLSLANAALAQRGGDEAMTSPPAGVRLPEGPGVTAMDMRFGKPSIEIMINGEGPFLLLVDTGASPVLILNDDLASELGLERSGSGRVGDPTDPGAIEVALHEIASVEIGGAVFSGFSAISWDRGTLYAGAEAPRGVVGFPMFRDVLVTFDYPRAELRLEGGRLEPGEHVVAYTAPMGIPHVPVTIGGTTYEAHLDSGSMGAFMLPLAMQHEVELASPVREMGRARTVNSEFAIYEAEFGGECSIAGHPIETPSLGFTDILPMPNVGSQVLKSFAVTFDQARSLARFDLAEGTRARAERARGGLGVMLGRRGDEYVVAGTLPDSPAAEAGLLEGDRLVAVNGKTIRDLPPGDLAVEMRRPLVVLTIDRDGTRTDVSVRRED